MKTLITGAEGFIGTKLSERILDADKVDLKSGYDILDFDVSKYDLIYHLAAQTDVQSSNEAPILDAMMNILPTIHLAENCKGRLIYPNSAAALDLRSPYGISKKTGAEYIKLLSDDYVICLFPNVYGEGSKGVVDKFLDRDWET